MSPTTIEKVELQTLADGEQRRVPATVVALDQGPASGVRGARQGPGGWCRCRDELGGWPRRRLVGRASAPRCSTSPSPPPPSPTNRPYPGGNGDVVPTITNPNPDPVTVTGENLSAHTVFASGFTNANLGPAQTGCSSSTSNVIWNFSTATSGTAPTLTSAVTRGPSGNANNPLTVMLTNDASMEPAAPAACENTFFSMPSLTGIAVIGGAVSVAAPPVTDSWTCYQSLAGINWSALSGFTPGAPVSGHAPTLPADAA